MAKMFKKRIPLSFLLLLLFLAVIPTTAFYAQQNVDQDMSSNYVEYWCGEGATVQSIYDDLTRVYPKSTVVVMDKNGNIRSSGLLEEGDIIQLFDETGEKFRTFVNINTTDSVPPTSEDADSNFSQSSSEDFAASSSESSSNGVAADSSQTSSENSGSESSPLSSAASSESSQAEFASESDSELSSAPALDESSAEPSDSNVSSEESSGTASDEVSLFGEQNYYEFSESVTVEELEGQLALAGVPGSQLTVQTSTGSIRQAGFVCTGDVLTVTNPDGTLQNSVTAVIAGDLTRCGFANEAAIKLLYGYLTDSATLTADLRRAADLNGDSNITTSDLLELKKMIAENS
ncbi:MAG: Dockerin domain-containing protein [Oscillospiraceae bacterium]|jgi:predicted transcriptional regulator